MKINLERLEVLKIELHGGAGPDYDNHEPIGLQLIMEAIRHYMFDTSQQDNDIILKLLTDYGVLVEEIIEDQKPIVPPHNFGG
jgi:hypothetical protein